MISEDELNTSLGPGLVPGIQGDLKGKLDPGGVISLFQKN